MKKILILLILTSVLLTCERDDICDGTQVITPQLIIDFYNTDSPDDLKNVTLFRVEGVSDDDLGALEDYDIVTSNDLYLPLKTDDTSTSFILYKGYVEDDDGVMTAGNADIITISYSPRTVYVSRACGYKTVFDNVVITLDDTDTDPWITSKDYTNENTSIEDETAALYNFYH